MKNFTALFFTFFILQTSHSQIYHAWTWVSGSSSNYQPGVYGTKGVTASTNVPGSRGSSTKWTDKNGNFWLFGGLGYDANNTNGFMNDLWKWNGANWTWMSGSNIVNTAGVYGVKGTPASTNVPPVRANSMTWTDLNGNLWLFGGQGNSSNYMNDLWEWDGTNWTWISGSNVAGQSGIYGTKGVPNANNVPGGRESGITWVDNSGNLWLFGGENPNNYYNDLWEWDGTNWTWISGSSSTNQFGVYGVKGVPSASNMPGSRNLSASWKDNSGNFWLLGGFGYPATGTPPLLMNDLWKWDGNNWTWMSGNSNGPSLGVYGTKGIAASSNVPGSRYGAGNWVDKNGNFWLFGGYGYDQSGSYGDVLNDLWQWDGTNWTWISGSSFHAQTGIYGSKGVPSTTNNPGARAYPLSWLDNTGNLWLFGGYYWNDLWKFDLASSVLPVSLTSFNGTLQNKKTILNWTTANETNNKGFAIERANDAINFKQIDFVIGYGTVTQQKNYDYTDVQPLSGKNYYRLKQTDLDGHFTYSAVVEVDNLVGVNNISIYPNPAKDIINISTIGINGNFEILDLSGRIIKIGTITNNNTNVDIKALPAATYILKIGNANAIFVKQ